MNYPTRQEVKEAIARKGELIQAQASARARADGHTETIKSSWFACAACEAALNAALAGVILAAIAGFPEDTPAIAAIAVACGLSEAVVTTILSGGAAGLETIINELCKAMNACS